MGQGIHKIEICLRGDSLPGTAVRLAQPLLQEKARLQFTHVTSRLWQWMISELTTKLFNYDNACQYSNATVFL